MTQYIATPFLSDDIVIVQTSAALKTLLQVATPSTTNIKIIGWGISFAGIVVTDPAGEVQLVDVNVAATVTTQTPAKRGNPDAQNSVCVGGTALTGYDASAEGTITASRILDPQYVHPQAGYAIWFPARAPILLKPSRFLRIRTDFSVDIKAIPWSVWEEPA